MEAKRIARAVTGRLRAVSTFPAAARAALFDGPQRPFALRALPVEPPRPGGAIARVTLATICGSDVHSWRGHRPSPVPGVLGHEMVGVIAALGDGDLTDLRGAPLAVGDRVTWSEYVPCWRCDRCVRLGLPQKCRRLVKYGHESANASPGLTGGFAELCHLLPGTPILKMPSAVTDADAVTVNCAGATMTAVLDAAHVGVGDCVVVQGLGALGLWGVALARAVGAGTVIGLDTVAERRAMARRFGADAALDPGDASVREVIDARGASGGADQVIETAGVPEALSSGLALLRIAGTYVTAGLVMASAPVAIDASALVRGLVTLRGVHNYHPDHLARALDFVARTRESIPFGDLVSARTGLDDIDRAFGEAAARRGVRTAIAP